MSLSPFSKGCSPPPPASSLPWSLIFSLSPSSLHPSILPFLPPSLLPSLHPPPPPPPLPTCAIATQQPGVGVSARHGTDRALRHGWAYLLAQSHRWPSPLALVWAFWLVTRGLGFVSACPLVDLLDWSQLLQRWTLGGLLGLSNISIKAKCMLQQTAARAP